MASCICPYCYERFEASEAVFRAVHSVEDDPEYALQEDKKLNNYRRKLHMEKINYIEAVINPQNIYEENKKKADGIIEEIIDKYGRVTRKRLCPHCHNELPFMFGAGPSHILSVIGASKVGKSTFLAALLYLLQYKSAENFNAVCGVADIKNKELLKRYEELLKNPELSENFHLYEDKIGRIIIYIKYKNSHRPPIALIFYDVSSKTFNNQDYLDIYGENIRNSSGILFLVEPSQLKKIREKQKTMLSKEDPRDIIVKLYENFISLEKGDKTQIPTAIVVTKSDEFKKNDYDFVEKNSRIYLNYEHKNYFDLSEFEKVNDEVQQIICTADPIFKDGIDMYFSNVAYFAVSSLGGKDSTEKLLDVQPVRVDEPLLWILHQLKYIDGRRK